MKDGTFFSRDDFQFYFDQLLLLLEFFLKKAEVD